MGLSVETVNRVLASFRGYAQYGAGILTALGIMSAANDKQFSDAVVEITTGVTQVIHGGSEIWQIIIVTCGPVISVVLARWSSHTAKVTSQAAQVQAAVIDPNTPVPLPAVAAIVDAAQHLTVKSEG
jgi:hypothetical protein